MKCKGISRSDFCASTFSIRKEALGQAAAEEGAELIRSAIRMRRRVHLVFSAANSQLDMVASLAAATGIDWSAAEIFHVDEYAGMPISHPASFARWVRQHVVEKVHPGTVHYLDGSAPDPAAECRRYGDLLAAAPIDISFLGIGEKRTYRVQRSA